MSQITTGIKSILSNPLVYNFLQWSVGGKSARQQHINEYIRPEASMTILDIGCGPAEILNFLPEAINYYGFDLNPDYIEHAKQKFGSKGTFICNDVNKNIAKDLPKFDLVLATAILHHLNDEEAIQLFKTAASVMKENGRLVTFDCCYTDDQSGLAKFIIKQDRGQNTRTLDEYQELAKKVFPDVKATIRHDLLRIPYTHIIMECRSHEK